MSYDIMYDKQFVKLPNDKFIPMILCGSNNVISYDRSERGRRSRDWWCHTNILKEVGSTFFGTAKEILDGVESVIASTVKSNANVKRSYEDRIYTEDEVRKAFGYFTSLAVGTQSTGQCTATKYYNLYKNGIKNSMTIKELSEANIHLEFSVYYYHKDKLSIPIPKWNRKNIESEKEFFSILKKAQKYIKDCVVTNEDHSDPHSPSLSLYFANSSWVEDRVKYIRKKEQRNWTGWADDIRDHFFTLQNDKGFLYKYTRNGYKYSWSSPMKFWKTFDEADKYRKSLISKGRSFAKDWRVERINKEHNFQTKIYEDEEL